MARPVEPEAVPDDRVPADPDPSFFGVAPGHARRVSVVCGDHRVDLSLPAAVPITTILDPVAEIFLERLRHTSTFDGPLVEALCGPPPHGPWELTRLGGSALDPEGSLASAGVADGEILVLAAPPLPTPEPLWDDSLAALSSAMRRAVWGPGDSRSAASAIVAVLAAAFLAVLLLALVRGSAEVACGLGAGGAAVALLYTVVARASGASALTATVGAAVATTGAGVSAAALVPGVGVGAAQLLAASGAGVVLGVAGGLVASRDPGTAPEATAFGTCGALALLAGVAAAATVWWPGGRLAVAVATGTAGWLLALAAPSIALALVRPSLPGSTADEGAIPEPLGMDEVRATERRLSRALLAVSVAASLCVVGGVSAALAAPGRDGWTVAWAVSIGGWLLLRVRTVPSRQCGFCVLTAGVATLLAAGAAGLAGADAAVASAAGGLALLVAIGVVAACGWWVPVAEFSPSARRVVDVVDVLVTCAVPPLALCAAGVLAAVRG